MILTMFLTAALAGAEAPPSDALIAEATQWLLAGDDLPADMNARLRGLPPAERMRVLVFLRRAGMMTGPGWNSDDLLAPAEVRK